MCRDIYGNKKIKKMELKPLTGTRLAFSPLVNDHWYWLTDYSIRKHTSSEALKSLHYLLYRHTSSYMLTLHII